MLDTDHLSSTTTTHTHRRGVGAGLGSLGKRHWFVRNERYGPFLPDRHAVDLVSGPRQERMMQLSLFTIFLVGHEPVSLGSYYVYNAIRCRDITPTGFQTVRLPGKHNRHFY